MNFAGTTPADSILDYFIFRYQIKRRSKRYEEHVNAEGGDHDVRGWQEYLNLRLYMYFRRRINNINSNL